MPTATWPGKALGGFAHEGGVFHRDGAEDDAGEALFQPHLDGAMSRMPPPSWAGTFTAQDRLDGGGVHRLAGEGAVQVDEVQPFAPGGLELQRLRGGVVAEDGGRVHLAAQKPDALAVLQVDGGVKDHGKAPAALRGLWHGRARMKSGETRPHVTLDRFCDWGKAWASLGRRTP
jgi:hypothetical protein